MHITSKIPSHLVEKVTNAIIGKLLDKKKFKDATQEVMRLLPQGTTITQNEFYDGLEQIYAAGSGGNAFKQHWEKYRIGSRPPSLVETALRKEVASLLAKLEKTEAERDGYKKAAKADSAKSKKEIEAEISAKYSQENREFSEKIQALTKERNLLLKQLADAQHAANLACERANDAESAQSGEIEELRVLLHSEREAHQDALRQARQADGRVRQAEAKIKEARDECAVAKARISAMEAAARAEIAERPSVRPAPTTPVRNSHVRDDMVSAERIKKLMKLGLHEEAMKLLDEQACA